MKKDYEIEYPQDIEPELLFMVLYNNSKQQGMGLLNRDGRIPITIDQAKELLEAVKPFKGERYFDYVNGRVMKIAIGGKVINTWGYDRDNGEDAVRNVITEIRAKKANFFELADKVLDERATKAEHREYSKLLEEHPEFQAIVNSLSEYLSEL